MALFFNSVKSFFVLILPMCNEPRVFGSPGRVRGPDVIQDFIAHSISSLAGFILVTLGQMTVAGAESSAMRKVDTPRVWTCTGFDDFLLLLNVEEALEPTHEVWVTTNEGANSVSEGVLVNEVLRVQIYEFEEFGVAGTIANLLLCTIKEGKFFLSGGGAGVRRERFRQLWHKSR